MSKKVLLYSGGMDSWLIDKLWKPDKKIYIDIGGRYSQAEKRRLPKDVEIVEMGVLGRFELDNLYVPMRNLIFLEIASLFGDIVCLGATLGDGGVDKDEQFLLNVDKLLKEQWNAPKCYKDISVETAFSRLSKGDLLDEYARNGGDLQRVKEESFSCYEGDKPCYSCMPCFRKFAPLYVRGVEYSKEEKEKMYRYIQDVVIPGKYDGTYFTRRRGESGDLISCVNKLRKEFRDE